MPPISSSTSPVPSRTKRLVVVLLELIAPPHLAALRCQARECAESWPGSPTVAAVAVLVLRGRRRRGLCGCWFLRDVWCTGGHGEGGGTDPVAMAEVEEEPVVPGAGHRGVEGDAGTGLGLAV